MRKNIVETPLRGGALAVAIINHILDDPKCWNQTKWHCGTRHCFLGWGQILGGAKPREEGIIKQVRVFLGISSEEADWASSLTRDFSELYCFAKALRDGDALDLAGFEGAGRDLYDRTLAVPPLPHL